MGNGFVKDFSDIPAVVQDVRKGQAVIRAKPLYEPLHYSLEIPDTLVVGLLVFALVLYITR